MDNTTQQIAYEIDSIELNIQENKDSFFEYMLKQELLIDKIEAEVDESQDIFDAYMTKIEEELLIQHILMLCHTGR